MSDETAKVSMLVDASPKRVWGALVDRVAIKQYFMGTTAEQGSSGVSAADRGGRADHEKTWSSVLEGLKKTVDG
jgi:uncharacterized protein YndB with AHSA1/START domain